MKPFAPIRQLLGLTGISLSRQLFWLGAGTVILAAAESLGFLMLVPLLRWAGLGGEGNAIVPLAMLGGLAVLRILIGFWVRVATTRLQHSAKDALRQRALDALLHAEWRWLAQAKAEDHAQILIQAIGQICGSGISQLVALGSSLCLLAAYIVVGLILSWQITAIALLGAAVLGWLLRGQRRLSILHGDRLVEASRAMFGFLNGGLGHIRELKITQGELRHLDEFDRVNSRFRRGQIVFDEQAARIQAAIQIGMIVAIGAVGYASVRWWQIELARLLPASLLLMRISPMLTNLNSQYNGWLQCVPLIANTRQFFDDCKAHAEPEAPATSGAIPLTRAIVLDEVRVRYAGRASDALAGVSLEIPANSLTVITGRSGAGKSTLADLLMGLIEPDAGEVRIDDIALCAATRRHWRSSVGYVQQNAALFDDTIRGNLLWGGPDASEADLRQSLEMASADFVFELPRGLDTRVGEAGLQLSGGERQRIALARALLRKPALLILDEATSALDKDNEAAIKQALTGLAASMTVVIIGHGQSMLEIGDQVVTLSRGKVQHRSSLA